MRGLANLPYSTSNLRDRHQNKNNSFTKQTYKHEESPIGSQHLSLASFQMCGGEIEALLPTDVRDLGQKQTLPTECIGIGYKR